MYDGRDRAAAEPPRAWRAGRRHRAPAALSRSRRTACPIRGSAKTREPLDAVEHVLGVGLVFPESRSQTAMVDYMTADVASMTGVDVEAPDEADELDEPEVAAA